MALISNNISGSASNQSKVGITGSVIIANAPGYSFPNLPTDAVFFVSGTIGGDDKSVFCGDVFFSGSLVQAQSNITTGSHNIVFGRNNVVVNDYVNLFGDGNIVADIFSALISVDTGLNELTVADGSTFQTGDEVAYVYEIINDTTKIHRTTITGISSNVLTVSSTVALDTTNGTMWVGLLQVLGYSTGTESILFCLSRKVQTSTFSRAEGIYSIAIGSGSYARGYKSAATGSYSYAEGYQSIATGYASHAEGANSAWASGDISHAEGDGTVASGYGSHSEGVGTTASGDYSHVEGNSGIASGQSSHAEGQTTVASGDRSHAEGWFAEATGIASHAEGSFTIASGDYSHAEGAGNRALGVGSHAGGLGTIASGSSQTAIGQYNLRDNDFSLFVVGNGASDDSIDRSDVFRVNQSDVQVTGSFVQANNGSSTIGFMGDEVGNATSKGTDVFFYVSGSLDALNGATPGVAMFGGDVRVSGTLLVGTGSVTITSNDIQFGTNGLRIERRTSDLSFNSTRDFVFNSTTTPTGNGKIIFSGSRQAGSETIASGLYAHAEGYRTRASDEATHAEGWLTTASYLYAHAEGERTQANAQSSHAEGYSNTVDVDANYSHAEGYGTLADAIACHTEGYLTTGSGNYSHAEGYSTVASGAGAHVEGFGAEARGQSSHAEGRSTTTVASYSHAEGQNTITSGSYSHAEGYTTETATAATHSHAEGYNTITSGTYSHAEGERSVAAGIASHAEGYGSYAQGNYSHAEGYLTTGSGGYSHAEGSGSLAQGELSHAEGRSTTASGYSSHAEGWSTIASGTYSHAEGLLTLATGSNSHAEGQQSTAASAASHAEGYFTLTTGLFSHAEGAYSRTSGDGSHAEGYMTTGSGDYSHAEGNRSIASGRYSHAEGGPVGVNFGGGTIYTPTIASGDYSHAEGVATLASGTGSHAEGYGTIASGDYSHAAGLGTIAAGNYQSAIGKYNVSDSSADTLFIIGEGASPASRTDALKVTTTAITLNNSTTFNGASNQFNDVVILDQGSTAGSTTLANNAIYWEYTSAGINTYRWATSIDSGGDLQFYYSLNSATVAPLGYVNNAGTDIAFNFTGQHRCVPDDNLVSPMEKIGLIVRSTGVVSPISGSFMSINDAVPTVELVDQRNDKRVFGVISNFEDNSDGTREFAAGAFVSVYEADPNDNRVFINSLGEGCVWICNVNGNVENGDYITSCEIPGYGMKQDDDLLHNYTVAKATMTCNFDLNSTAYNCEEFIYNGVTYRRAFIACTYHCG